MKSARIAAVMALALLAATAARAAGTHHGDHEDPGAHVADTAIGKPGVAANATRTISVDMNDAMRFTPANVEGKQDETVRFLVRNSGALAHELVLGTGKDLQAHHEAMKKDPAMQHAEPNMVTLAPGKTGDVVWHFTSAGKVDFACLQPGHYDLGMKGVVNVAGRSPAK